MTIIEVNVCSVNQWTGFYMIGTSVIKKLSMYDLLVDTIKFALVYSS